MTDVLEAADVRHVSRVLNAAGVPKAGRYTAWGYLDRDGNPKDGFLIYGGYGSCRVLTSYSDQTQRGRDAQVAVLEQAEKVLTESGKFVVERDTGRVSGRLHALNVRRKA